MRAPAPDGSAGWPPSIGSSPNGLAATLPSTASEGGRVKISIHLRRYRRIAGTCTSPGGRPQVCHAARTHSCNVAEVQSAIKMPKTKMERIAFAPLRPQQLSCAHGRLRIQAVAASSLIKLAGLRDVPEGSRQNGKVLNQSMASLCASEFSQIWLRNLACWFAFFDECRQRGLPSRSAPTLSL